MKIVGASIGNCVHVAGILSFLGLARSVGHEVIFLGPAVSVDELLQKAREEDADMIAISYRLTPEVAQALFEEIEEKIPKYGLKGKLFVFGGTSKVADVARKFSFFSKVFSKESRRELIMYLKGQTAERKKDFVPAQTLLKRIEENAPYPIIRHHFGRPTLEETVKGIEKISESGLIDVISLAPDQNAQQYFFEPEKMKPELSGAGGVPIRKREDLLKLHEASQRGNYPLMRCYAGTTHIVEMAKVLHETINNAWAAIPLSWYNELDGRSERKFVDAVRENMEGIKWNAEQGLPVEINEPHQWTLRSAHDTIFVTMSYIAAYVAKKLGVKNYVSQYMLNTPPGVSFEMDLAKMFAAKEMISTLEDDDFKVITEVRPGLMIFPPDANEAKGQLGLSITEGMFLKPQIVHVVAYTEADHAAKADEIIQSLKIAKRVIEESVDGLPDARETKNVSKRIDELISEATTLIEEIKQLSSAEEPLLDPETYYKALKMGYLDTPNFIGSKVGRGKIVTAIIDGKCEAIDPKTSRILKEKERIEMLKRAG
jgi:methylmalonyl-CoA mutase cobalamin-binding subunit